MVVATHNPSNLVLETVELKVPHDRFQVQIFKDTEWLEVQTNVVCNEQQVELKPKLSLNNCRMFVDQTILPG